MIFTFNRSFFFVSQLSRKIYFVDARLDTLDVMQYDGKKRRTILKSGLIKHPFGMAIFEDYLYFTDWTPGSIRRLSRRDASSKMIFKEQLTKPMGIQVIHESKQRLAGAVNYCANATCTHLCLLRPGGFSCKCPFGYELKKDDNTSCVSKLIFYITPVIVLRLTDFHSIGLLALVNSYPFNVNTIKNDGIKRVLFYLANNLLFFELFVVVYIKLSRLSSS